MAPIVLRSGALRPSPPLPPTYLYARAATWLQYAASPLWARETEESARSPTSGRNQRAMRPRLARRQGDVAVAQDALEGGEAGGRIATLTLLLRDDHLGRWSHVALNGLAEIANGHLVELVAIGEVVALCTDF